MELRRRRIDHVTDPAYVQDLGSLTMEELRDRRRVLDDLDTEFSFYRRMLHGRMDLLAFEMKRRSGEETRSLIEALPQILADGIDGPSRNTIPKDLSLTLPELSGTGNRSIDRVLGDGFLAHLPSLEDDELEEIQATLTEAEKQVSTQRRAVYDVYDRINEEIARRYRKGLVDTTGLFEEQ
ncbi:MAG: aerial mycelium formation protein [Actinomycetia bacterium]|nr:aerial mycelium formation protein [Actinomycetes bacterium]